MNKNNMTPTWFVVYHPFSNNKFLLPDLFQTCFKNFENLSIVDGTKSFSFPGCTLVRIVLFECTRLCVTSAWFYPR